MERNVRYSAGEKINAVRVLSKPSSLYILSQSFGCQRSYTLGDTLLHLDVIKTSLLETEKTTCLLASGSSVIINSKKKFYHNSIFF